jgi:arylsulfatase
MPRSLSFLLAVVASSVQLARADAPRPNIILIMCDDMGWSDIGCYGGEVQTPNLDRLAAGGLRFTHFYNNAKCTTTRASIVTGLYPRPKGGLLKQNMTTLGEVLGDAGYQTVLTGKWHLGRSETTHPFHRGFDEYYGLLDGCCNFFDPSLPDPKYKGGRVRYFAHNDQRLTEFPDDFYTTDAFTDHAIETIRKYSKNDKPFFAHICYTAPHYPLHAKPADIEKYVGKFRMGWEAMRRQRYQRQIDMGLIESRWKLSDTDSKAYGWESADQKFEDHRMAVYAAMIDSMDQNIGWLVSTLDELGIKDNTLVLFLSDNGGCSEEPGGRVPQQRTAGPKDDYVAVGPAWGWAQNAPFRRYKSWVNEGGISTPLIAHWPGKIEEGQLTHQVGHIIDFLPTFVDLAGGEYPQQRGGQAILPVEGKSLAPIFAGRQRTPHEHLYWEWAGNSAVREGKWKLVWDKLVKRWELYDLEADRTETNNLSEAEPQRAAELAKLYDQWAQETGNRRVNAGK